MSDAALPDNCEELLGIGTTPCVFLPIYPQALFRRSMLRILPPVSWKHLGVPIILNAGCRTRRISRSCTAHTFKQALAVTRVSVPLIFPMLDTRAEFQDSTLLVSGSGSSQGFITRDTAGIKSAAGNISLELCSISGFDALNTL